MMLNFRYLAAVCRNGGGTPTEKGLALSVECTYEAVEMLLEEMPGYVEEIIADHAAACACQAYERGMRQGMRLMCEVLMREEE